MLWVWKDSAVVETLEAISASAAAMAVAFRQGTAHQGQHGADPLREQADAFLDGLAGVGRDGSPARGRKSALAAGYAGADAALAPPAASPQEHTAQVMSVTAEVACALTISERSAGALLDEAHDPDHGPAADAGRAAGRDRVLAACAGDV